MLTLLASIAVGPASIIPRPASLAYELGTFTLAPTSRIAAPKDLRQDAEMLRSYLRPATGYALEIGRGGSNAINLTIDKHLQSLGDEGYELEVKGDRVDLRAYAKPGLFYGFQTLRQLLPTAIMRKATVSGVAWTMPCVKIQDAPRFHWRGAMMDSSRHFMPKDSVLRFLDTLALHKLNSFHWHLTDDNGWRLEIRKYPKLTEIGGWQPQTLPDYDPPQSPVRGHGGFYTQDDVREVVAYAAARHINVVPEIEMPGHAGAIIASYPECGTPASNVLNSENSTIRFMQDVLDEVMTLFPSKFIHVGGDEVDKGPWNRDPKTQARIKELGLKDEDELQSWIIRQMDAYLTKNGRRLIGWDEILQGGLAEGATVMSWRGTDGGIAAAKTGHDVVMAPTSHTYLDYYQADPSIEPRAIGGYVPLETVYSFEPIPQELTDSQAAHVLGLQGQLWSEYLPNPRQMEYMAWPRLTAISEVGWSPAAGKSYDDFMKRLPVDLERLKALDVNFRPLLSPVLDAVGKWTPQTIGEVESAKEFEVKVPEPGSYQALFTFLGGTCRLDIRLVELLQDGVVLTRDDHIGQTGSINNNNAYLLEVADPKPGARYVIRCWIRSDGGSDSTGTIRFTRTQRPR